MLDPPVISNVQTKTGLHVAFNIVRMLALPMAVLFTINVIVMYRIYKVWNTDLSCL